MKFIAERSALLNSVVWKGDNIEEVSNFVSSPLTLDPLRGGLIVPMASGANCADPGDFIVKYTSGKIVLFSPLDYRKLFVEIPHD